MFICKLAQRFRPRYWYWEYVIFVRRIVVCVSMQCRRVEIVIRCHGVTLLSFTKIAYFAVGVSGEVYDLPFSFVLMAFIWVQWHYRPFLTSEANQVMFRDVYLHFKTSTLKLGFLKFKNVLTMFMSNRLSSCCSVCSRL